MPQRNKTKMIRLSALTTNPDNPRIIKDKKFEELIENIKAFPRGLELRPIVYDKDGMIIAGNMRYAALKHLGYEEIPEEWTKKADDFTPEELERFLFIDNSHSGQWNWAQIKQSWDKDKIKSWGITFPARMLKTQAIAPVKKKISLHVEFATEEERECVFKELIAKGLKCTKNK